MFVVLRGNATFVAGEWILSEDAVLLTYGNFIQAIIDFLIIALAIFLALKVITKLSNRLQKVKDAIAPKDEEVKE
jgi:large conductance mechanosensitive channel